jgi:hypothetical protein
MRIYLVTLVYRLPAVPGRREVSVLERRLGQAHASSSWTDGTLEVQLWAQAPRPSDAVALAHRRVADLWPTAGTARHPTDDVPEVRPATERPELRAVSWQYVGNDGPADPGGVREPRRPAPSSGHLAAALTIPGDPALDGRP